MPRADRKNRNVSKSKALLGWQGKKKKKVSKSKALLGCYKRSVHPPPHTKEA